MGTTPQHEPQRQESSAWLEAYGSGEQRDRRRSQLPEKLRLLGLDRGSKDVRILDLCCGNCETLMVLHDMGFRDLHGIDLHLPSELAADSRFHAEAGDASHPGKPDAAFDWILIIHALHHLGTPEQIQHVLQECYRMLKPGGRLGVVDFPNSPQIRLAFWFFRQNVFLWTPYLRYFASLIQEEWPFLQYYLPAFPRVRKLLEHGPFEIESRVNRFFYFYLTLRKAA